MNQSATEAKSSAAGKPPLIATAVGTTGAALLDLAVGLLSIANLSPATQSTQMPIIAIFVLISLGLIALAVLQWVLYFRAYVDFRIDQLRQQQQSSVTQPPLASAPARD